ncbi:MAG: DUF2207 domain-containing protein, partial [Clostridia bacterium]|nr:DUF2207 domain-containing protein [Clostridia bacterium]
IQSLEAVWDIQSNREIHVTERVQINYDYNTGFIRDIPVNGGELVKNVKVYEIKGEKAAYVYYDVDVDIEYRNFVTVDIGDYSTKSGTYTYLITYDYCLTKAQEGKNFIAVTPVGAGWPKDINFVSVKLILPQGYKDGSALCYISGSEGRDLTKKIVTEVENDRVTLSITPSYGVAQKNALTFEMEFENGALKTYFDFTPYWVIIAGAIILAVVVIFKFLVFNKTRLLPVVNYEAPDRMDPLMMGKLIDNKVNSEDVTSLIYYWADRGYLKINLDNKASPVLIRIVQHLPETSASYERDMFNSLFASGEVVQINDLRYVFYPTINRVTAQVNKQTKGLYNSASIGVSILFAVLGGILLGLAPLILGMVQISPTLMYFTSLIAIVPALIIYALTETIMYNRMKMTKKNIALFSLGLAALCLFCGVFYVLFTPGSLIGLIPKILLCLISFAIIICSVFIVSRTKDYNDKLGDIVGFRNFILLAEKNQLETMLEEDPQFYYHVLPYAQVLGVTDKWEEKFNGLTVQPPQYVAGNVFTNVVSFHIMNNILRNSMSRISSNMISAPSSSGLSGGFGGGSFGGGGGGHGGGGGRFR